MERVTTITPGLVLEQDFILQVRRLQKTVEPHWVLNVQFANMPALVGKRDLMDSAQDRLHEFARQQGGELYLMTNGDAFLVMPEVRGEEPITFGARMVTAALPQGMDPGRSPVGWLQVFPMPDSYLPLRERVNYYIELAKEIEESQADTPEVLLQSEEVRGPLTAYSLSQIERLLDDIDTIRYMRSQNVYQANAAGKWGVVYEENYISTHELQKEKFPRLEIRASGRLFAEMASMLDRRTLAAMIRGQDRWRGRVIGLNLSVGTVLSSVFAQFLHVVHGPARQNVCFEIHVSELLHDLRGFLSALELLTKEGFRVSIDGVSPQMLPYLRLETLPVNYIKLSVDSKGTNQLAIPQVMDYVRAIDPAKLIFMHVETPEALELGSQLGVTKYQGFYLDEQLAPKK